MANGNESVRSLFDLLIKDYGKQEFFLVGQICDETDAIGWKMRRKPDYLFSVSTLGGELPFNNFDLQISISNKELDHGEICFNEDVTLNNIKTCIENVLNDIVT